ncbi:hypothetical protein CKAH01_11656 [Colletotrichum kahawae]|uniref:Uncharacterized protein n=1 Tax=Colletotrichum kahawae TaxID=34407 RepID=A0AAD9YU83_COLKA|nr:hypothetical protein CKAH01_11656 [Colletotrichum kahawae]
MVGRSLAPGEISSAGMPSPTPTARHRRRRLPCIPQPPSDDGTKSDGRRQQLVSASSTDPIRPYPLIHPFYSPVHAPHAPSTIHKLACARPSQSHSRDQPAKPTSRRGERGGHSHSRSRSNMTHSSGREKRNGGAKTKGAGKPTMYLTTATAPTRRWMLGQIKCVNLKFPSSLPPPPWDSGEGSRSRSGARTLPTGQLSFCLFASPPLSREQMGSPHTPLRLALSPSTGSPAGVYRPWSRLLKIQVQDIHRSSELPGCDNQSSADDMYVHVTWPNRYPGVVGEREKL